MANLNDNKVTVTVDDEKMTGSYQLQLIKQDKITKAKLSGVEFNVQIGNSEAKKYTTDANGIISVPAVEILETGKDIIKISEVKAPDGYKEIKNCNLIQIMEGMYNTLIATNVNLRNILIYYFSNFKTSKKILTKRDKRKSKDPNNTEIFIYKANNHRHYLSHLNLKQNKNVFYGLENIYAYWKLVLSIRVFILEYVGINYNYDYVVKYIKEVDDWAKKQKLRFSARINN